MPITLEFPIILPYQKLTVTNANLRLQWYSRSGVASGGLVAGGFLGTGQFRRWSGSMPSGVDGGSVEVWDSTDNSTLAAASIGDIAAGGGGMASLGVDGIYRTTVTVAAAGSLAATVPLDQQYGMFGNVSGTLEFDDEYSVTHNYAVVAPWFIPIRAKNITSGTDCFPFEILKGKVSTP